MLTKKNKKKLCVILAVIVCVAALFVLLRGCKKCHSQENWDWNAALSIPGGFSEQLGRDAKWYANATGDAARAAWDDIKDWW